MYSFSVYRNSKKIDTVFNISNSPKKVKDGLVAHDGYPIDITVKRARNKS